MEENKQFKLLKFGSGEMLYINIETGMNFDTMLMTFSILADDKFTKYKDVEFKIVNNKGTEFINPIVDGKPLFSIPKEMFLGIQTEIPNENYEILLSVIFKELQRINTKYSIVEIQELLNLIQNFEP